MSEGRARRLVRDAIELDGPTCTGIAAVWCPRCGDCSCPRAEDGEIEGEGPDCPLHSVGSSHAEQEWNR